MSKLSDIADGKIYDETYLKNMIIHCSELTFFEKCIIKRFINGSNNKKDRFELHRIAIKHNKEPA